MMMEWDCISVLRLIARRPVALGLLVLLSAVETAFAHEPAKVVMYPASAVYAEKGFEIPELSDDTIAILHGEPILKDEYKQWLNKKVGFAPAVRDFYFTSRYMEQFFADREVDLSAVRQLLLDHVYEFEMLERLYSSCDEWRQDYAEFELGQVELTKEDIERSRVRVKELLYPTAYLIVLWDELTVSILSELGVDPASLTVEGDDPVLKNLIRLNNAYYLVKRHLGRLQGELRNLSLAGVDLQVVEPEEYEDWVFREYQSPLFTENFLAMRLVWGLAQKEDVSITDQAVEELLAQRIEIYQQGLDSLNALLPEGCKAMEVEPAYAEYMKWECRVDLLGSRMYRTEHPLKDYQIVKKFYDQYGFKGERCKASEVFKWVRKKRLSSQIPENQEQLEEQEVNRARAELESIRSAIAEAGLEKFPLFALTENLSVGDQNKCGYVELPQEIFDAASFSMLNQLGENEMTEVFESSGVDLHLVWMMERTEKGPQFYKISRGLFGRSGYNLDAFETEFAIDWAELERLRGLVQDGESIEELAQTHSDSFNKYGADISDVYQSSYGFAFANELSSMNDGDLKLIASQKGIHLVQLHSRQVSELTDEIKEGFVREYLSVRASDDELNELSKLLLYRANPYFRDQ